MRENIHFDSRHSYVRYQIQSAIVHEINKTNRSPDIHKLVEMTGYSEESILESLEFGDLDCSQIRFHYSTKFDIYRFN